MIHVLRWVNFDRPKAIALCALAILNEAVSFSAKSSTRYDVFFSKDYCFMLYEKNSCCVVFLLCGCSHACSSAGVLQNPVFEADVAVEDVSSKISIESDEHFAVNKAALEFEQENND